jgi:hypothetical protein
MSQIPFPGGAADQDVFFHEDKVCVYHKAINTWECRTINTGSTEAGQPAAVTTQTVFTIPLPTDPDGAVADSPLDLPDLRTQYDVNWFLADDLAKRERKVIVQDNPPLSHPLFTGEQANFINGDLWYDTSRLEMFVYWNDAWFPTSAPPADYDLEVEQFGYELNRVKALLDEIYLKNVQQDDRLTGIENDIIELEEEIEAIAPSLERGKWNYKQILENRAYTLFDGSGQSTDMFNNVASIYVSNIDADGNPHGFDDVVAESYIEIFNDTDADFGLYVIKDIDDKSNMTPGYWIFTVDFIKSNRLPSRANGLARFKFFEAPTGGDASQFVRIDGDTMTGTLNMKDNAAIKTRNLDSGENSNLELKHNGVSKVYVGSQKTTFQEHIKFAQTGKQVYAGDDADKNGLAFYSNGVQYAGAYSADKHVATKKNVDAAKEYVDQQIEKLLAKIEELEMAGGTTKNYQFQIYNRYTGSSGTIGSQISVNQIMSVTSQNSYSQWNGSGTSALNLERRGIFLCLPDNYQLNSGRMIISEKEGDYQHSRYEKTAGCVLSDVEKAPPEVSNGKNIYRAHVHVDEYMDSSSQNFFPNWSDRTYLWITFADGAITEVS